MSSHVPQIVIGQTAPELFTGKELVYLKPQFTNFANPPETFPPEKDTTVGDLIWRFYASFFLVIYLPMNILYIAGTIEKHEVLFHECEGPSYGLWIYRLAMNTLVSISLVYSFRYYTWKSIYVSIALMVIFCFTFWLTILGCSIDGDYFVHFHGAAGAAAGYDLYFHEIAFIISMIVFALACFAFMLCGACTGGRTS